MGEPTGGENFACKPGVLKDLADQADTIGNELVELASYTVEESASTVENYAGWQIAAAVKEAQAVWEYNMKGFGRQLSDVGDRLWTSAENYEAADRRGAGRMGGR